MEDITDTYGCVHKNTMINLDDGSKMAIENIWNKFCEKITMDDRYPEVEFASLNNDLSMLSYDGKNFIFTPVKQIIRHKTYNCVSELWTANNFNIAYVNPFKILTENGWTNTLNISSSIAIPRKHEEYGYNDSGYCSYILDGNLLYTKVVTKGTEIINDYVYSFIVNDYHNFLANGIVCGDFIRNNEM